MEFLVTGAVESTPLKPDHSSAPARRGQWNGRQVVYLALTSTVLGAGAGLIAYEGGNPSAESTVFGVAMGMVVAIVLKALRDSMCVDERI